MTIFMLFMPFVLKTSNDFKQYFTLTLLSLCPNVSMSLSLCSYMSLCSNVFLKSAVHTCLFVLIFLCPFALYPNITISLCLYMSLYRPMSIYPYIYMITCLYFHVPLYCLYVTMSLCYILNVPISICLSLRTFASKSLYMFQYPYVNPYVSINFTSLYLYDFNIYLIKQSSSFMFFILKTP